MFLAGGGGGSLETSENIQSITNLHLHCIHLLQTENEVGGAIKHYSCNNI